MKKLLLILVSLSIVMSSVVLASSFSDLNVDHWAYENIMELTKRKVINGYPDGTFRPSNSVTYGEFIKLTICAYVPEDKIINFEGSHWAEKYVNTAEFYEMLPTKSIRVEQLDEYITRSEMVKFLMTIDRWIYSYDFEIVEMPFTDIDDLPNEYIEYISAAYKKGYIIGKPGGMFDGSENLSRAEMVTILSRIEGNNG